MNFKEYIENNHLDESINIEIDIINNAISNIKKAASNTPKFRADIEAFIMFADSYKSYKEALKDLENLGSYKFQNSYNDKWDEEGYEGKEFKDVIWGDLADLSLSEITSYKEALAKSISKDRAEEIIKKLQDIIA